MKYDATGKNDNEINKEAVRLAETYENVEVKRKDGKITIICKGGRKANKRTFKIGKCEGCNHVGRVRQMDSGHQICRTCWFVVENRLWEVVKGREAKRVAG